jgi:hypothetical protein
VGADRGDGVGDAADSQLAAALAAIDAANAEDPTTIVVAGQRRPKELAHAELVTGWIRCLDPDADDAQILAGRASHLRRWTTPRSDFPDGRVGYRRWRTEAKARHAEEVAALLAGAGYADDVIARVQAIIRKDGLGTDPAVQVHEDALCLVFLETQLDEVADGVGDDKAVEILARTAVKMSPAAVEAAGTLGLSARGAALWQRAQPPPG